MKNRCAEPHSSETKNGKMKLKSEKSPHYESEVVHNEKDKTFLKESLLLPSTSIGKTTSASICERSNVWAEHRLDEKKNDLDQLLYKKIVRLNSDRLEVVSELANLKKSSSTGNLARDFGGIDGLGLSRGRKDFLHTRSKSNSGQCSPTVDRKTNDSSIHSGHAAVRPTESLPKPSSASLIGSQRHNRRHSQDKDLGSGKLHRKTLLSQLENSAKISVRLGSDSSSDDSDSAGAAQDSCDNHEASNTCMKHGQTCRGCMEERSQSHRVENVTRRYAKQLSSKRGDK